MPYLQKLFLSATFTLLILCSAHAEACTRILDANNSQAVLVGRTMDWYEDLQTNLVIYPQGIAREGMTEANPIQWTSKYANIVASAFDVFSTDGLNEKGLAAHILWLDQADYGVRDANQPGLNIALWVQYYLDNFATVQEAVDYTQNNPLQIVSVQAEHGPQGGSKLHLALEDASGYSAIIEYTDHGQLNIYHNRTYQVVTNSPVYSQQRLNLLFYKDFGGSLPLPGSTASKDRFVRASYYASRLPRANSTREAITAMISVVDNIVEPYSVSTKGDDIEPTLWRSISDLTHTTYYFNNATSLGYMWVNLHNFHLQAGSPIMKLSMCCTDDMVGDVSQHFKPIVAKPIP
jgi:choloylglycine hydrolase